MFSIRLAVVIVIRPDAALFRLCCAILRLRGLDDGMRGIAISCSVLCSMLVPPLSRLRGFLHYVVSFEKHSCVHAVCKCFPVAEVFDFNLFSVNNDDAYYFHLHHLSKTYVLQIVRFACIWYNLPIK